MKCINEGAHDNPDLYCVWCGWVSNKLKLVAQGIVPKWK